MAYTSHLIILFFLLSGAVEQRVAGEIAKFNELGTRRSACQRLANGGDSGRDGEAREPVVMVSQNHAPWTQQIGLLGDELGEGSLDGLAVDGATTSCSQDSDIRA